MGDLLLRMEALRGVELDLEPLTIRCYRAGVDALVLRVVTPVVLAVDHSELVCLEPVLDIPVAICVLTWLKAECIADRVRYVLHNLLGRGAPSTCLQEFSDLFLQAVLALDAELQARQPTAAGVPALSLAHLLR